MEEIDLCWRITNHNPDLKKKFVYKSIVYHLGGGSLSYNDPKKLYYNIRNHSYMIIKNTNISQFSYFFGSSKLDVIRRFNLLLLLYYFINFRFKFIPIFLKLWRSLDFAKSKQEYFLLQKIQFYA